MIYGFFNNTVYSTCWFLILNFSEIADVSLDQPDATSTPNPQSRTQKNLGITHRHQVNFLSMLD